MNSREKAEKRKIVDRVTKVRENNIFIMDVNYWKEMGTKELTKYVRDLIYSAYTMGVADEAKEHIK